MDNTQKGLVDSEGRIDLKDPRVRARAEELAAHAQRDIEMTLVSNHPELLNADMESDRQNREAIHAYMNENELPLTPETIELAYRATLAAGMLVLPMYSVAELEAFPRMTREQLKYYLEKSYQAPRPPNMWEFFPQAGERRWGDDAERMDEEAAAALRARLLGRQ